MLVKKQVLKAGTVKVTVTSQNNADKKLIAGLLKTIKEDEKEEARKAKETAAAAPAKKGIAKKTPAKKKPGRKPALKVA